MLVVEFSTPMPRHSHSSRSRHASSRRYGVDDEESSQKVGMAIGALLIVVVLAGLGLVVRGLF